MTVEPVTRGTPAIPQDRLMKDLESAAKRPRPRPDDGTMPLLKGGVWTLGVGLLAAISVRFFMGGMGPHGPHTNLGWLILIVALMCLPFGSMILLLGVAKWLRFRRMSLK